MKSKKLAIEAIIDEIEKHEIPPGEIEIRFIDGDVFSAKFSHVSEEEWKRIDDQRNSGIVGFMRDLFWKRPNADVTGGRRSSDGQTC